MRFYKAVCFSLLLFVAGCRSHYIAASIANDTATPISVVQVDYPSASFGTQTLASNQVFQYRFKIQGSGQVKLTWLTSDQQELHATGPELQEGQEGRLEIRFLPGADPSFRFTPLVH